MLFERGAVDARAEDLVEARCRRRVQPGAAPRQRGVARLQQLRQSLFQHRRARRPLPGAGARPRRRSPAWAIGVRARITLAADHPHGAESRERRGRRSRAGGPARPLCLNAHVDGWFDGAGDNADGLAVLMALARHFGRPEHRPDRTLVLVASAGHHTPGINGPRSFVAANPDLAKCGGDAGQHRARRAAQFLAGPDHGSRWLSRGRGRLRRGADRGRRHQRVAVPAGAHRRRTGPLRRELHLGAIHVPERRDRRLVVAFGRQGERDAGAAPLSHDGRGAGRHLASPGSSGSPASSRTWSAQADKAPARAINP